MAHEPCLYTLIYIGCIVFITWPLYIYFLLKWYSHRHHFVIRNRWPVITLIIVASSIIIQLLAIIESAFCSDALWRVSIGVSNAISGLVYYRSYLLYARTIETRKHLSEVGSLKRIFIQNEQSHYRHQILSKIILSAIIMASVTVSVCNFINIPTTALVYTSFTITTLIGIICVINILYKKVSDSIGITKECIVQISLIFLILIIPPCLMSVVPSTQKEILFTWLGLVGTSTNALFSLFIAYHLIQKAEASANAKPTTRMETARSISSGLSIETNGCTAQTDINHIIPELKEEHSLPKWLNTPLVTFLGDDLGRHTLFAGYLSECFALENILFLERAIILHHVIKKYKEIDVGVCDDVKQFNGVFYGLKFNFLSQIYDDIEQMIEENKANDGYKGGIVKVIKCIYNQFCCRDAVAEINIGYEAKTNLYRFCEMDDGQILKEIKSYDELLMVLHYAISECWMLCETIYGFQFKSYLRDKLIENSAPNEPCEGPEKPELSISLVSAS